MPPRSIALSRINNDKPTEQNSLKSHSVVMSRQQSIGQIGRTTEQDYRDSICYLGSRHGIYCHIPDFEFVYILTPLQTTRGI